jgi:hypothetical protein
MKFALPFNNIPPINAKSIAKVSAKKIKRYNLSLEFSTYSTLVDFFGFRETFLPSLKIKTGC